MTLIQKLYSKLLFCFYKQKLNYLGKKTFFKGSVWFHGEKYINIQNRCSIGPYCRIEAHSNNSTNTPMLVIGEKTCIEHAVHIYCADKVEIGSEALIASGCMITDNNHGINPTITRYVRQPLISNPTIIESGVWLGENVSVLSGTFIGKKSIIGANSVVSGKIPSYSIAVGNPAKVIKRYNFDNNKWERINL